MRKATHEAPLVDKEAKKLGYQEKSSHSSMPASKKPVGMDDKDYGRESYPDAAKGADHSDTNKKKSY